MSRRTFDEILQEVEECTPDEQRQLREALDRLEAGRKSLSPEAEVERRLFEAGLLSEIKPPVTDLAPYRDRRPAKVKGKPLSEVIVEDRR